MINKVFKKERKGVQAVNEVTEDEVATKYENPKILLVDIDEETKSRLISEGFNVDGGTFGYPFHSKEDEICELNGSLPFLLEKDLVIVKMDSEIKIKTEHPKSNSAMSHLSADDKVLVTPRRKNYFDGRSLYSLIHGPNFNQLMKNGSILVVFADTPQKETYYISKLQGGTFYAPDTNEISNYAWLPGGTIDISNCMTGKEIVINEKVKEFAENIIKDSIDDISYNCEFRYIYDTEESIVLYRNRSNNPIGFIKFINKGTLIVLPRFNDYYKPLSNLIKEVLPVLKPDLFPDFTKNKWVDAEEYLFPNVKTLIEEKELVIEEHNQKLQKLDKEILSAKERFSFLFNILTSNGYSEFLVENLKKTLEIIGYKNVLDVDEVIEGNKQEDLRILDDNRLTIIEIKGHKGRPTEDDCQAVVKYVNRTMKKEGRVDVHGILIVNHQRMLPPLEREYPGYTPEQIVDANRDDYTLVTTWELFKSVRLLQEGLITFEDIDKALHTKGLFTAIPTSWSYLGDIQHIFNRNKEDNIACFYLEAENVQKGDTLIIKEGNDYSSQIVEEMKIDNADTSHAGKGDQLAIKINKIISKSAQIYVKSS